MFFFFHKKPIGIKLIILIGFFLLSFFNSKAQSLSNLVNNPSAEQFTACPTNFGQVSHSNYWFLPTLNGSSDYYNSCASGGISVPSNLLGFQFPRTGNAYFGFALYPYREDIESGLKQTFKSGKTYCVSFYVSLAEQSRYAISNIGVYFTQDSLKNYWPSMPPVNYYFIPHVENSNSNIITDTINWTQVQGTYLANGTERFISIGNFRDNPGTNFIQVKPLLPPVPPIANMAYYYIDDISVVEINSADASLKDSLIKCSADSVQLGTDSTEFATYQWQSTAAGMAALTCTNCPNPIAKPIVTTKYYLTKVQCSSTTKDSVIVVVLTPTTQANAGNDKTICIGDYVQIGIQDSSAFTNYSWQFAGTLSCTNCAQPFVNPTVSTTYTVQRTECTNVTMDTVRVIVDDCEPTYTIANVFTPNYDDVNDTWGIDFSTVNSHIKNFKMNIYDRWGLLVYESNSEQSTPNTRWDGHTTSGEECSSGVYYYVVTFEKNSEHILLKGNLSLFQ
jgi:gliding motility-associated-like protein